jgi:diketogulonate reductase-like aldo/keto reductase
LCSRYGSLEHLGTNHVDSYTLYGLQATIERGDAEVWDAMTKERNAGRTRLLGVSNVSLHHLEQMTALIAKSRLCAEPLLRARRVGSQCASFCRERIIYQGFSLDRE